MKRIISLLLLVVIVATLLASCTNGKNDNGNEKKTEETEEEVYREAEDGITETFNNANCNFIIPSAEEIRPDLVRDELAKEALNDAIYYRNQKVANRLKINLKLVEVEDPIDTANTAILGGLDSYQIVADGGTESYAAASTGIFVNLNGERNKYVHTDQPWWNSYIADRATIYNQLYTVTGDLSLSLVKKCFAIFFNKEVLTDLGSKMTIEELFELVESGIDAQGGWTYDEMLNLIKGVNNGELYGLCMDNSCTIDAFWSAFDINLIERKSDGGIEFASDRTKITKVADDLLDKLMFSNKDVNVLDCRTEGSTIGASGEEISVELSEDRTLLAILRLGNAEWANLRGMSVSADGDDGYGIIPMPKYDSFQTNYYTFSQDGYIAFSIPKTVKNTDLATATLEALGSQSYSTVAPVFYDDILQGKYMEDPYSADMMDIITTNIKVDFTWIHSFAFPTTCPKPAQNCFRETVNNFGKKSFAIYWSSFNKPLSKAIVDLNTTYKQLGGIK